MLSLIFDWSAMDFNNTFRFVFYWYQDLITMGMITNGYDPKNHQIPSNQLKQKKSNHQLIPHI